MWEIKLRMSRADQSLVLFLLPCLCHLVETGQILPPQNISYHWNSDFQLHLSWAPPVTNCTYQVVSETCDRDGITEDNQSESTWKHDVVMEGGNLTLSVRTLCNNTHSEPAVLKFTYPVLVTDLQCYVRSSEQSYCSWVPASRGPVLRFFYWRLQYKEAQLEECPSYSFTEDMRTGCNLQVKYAEEIFISFNATLKNSSVKNTFKKHFLKVRPPPLNWTVTKSGDKFNITWIPPDVTNEWMFKIKYTECGKETQKTINKETSLQLDLVPHCPYRMAIMAEHHNGATPWSDEKMFDAETDPNVLVYLAIIIPLTFSVLAVLMFVCCRNNKENIFPKVPQPRDLLSDISNNNNNTKNTAYNLYIPVEEEENCKITLVTDTLINKPNC
ncbi:interleukin-13 receptor subunit alpha-1 [Mastacembelus armatus]|uniref:Interleukin 13 receptor, alpha 1 n=1 Tax=Mastacembelus armatus TaxID=205130 RepID=A0A3Q3LA07_9TELE|nr:uncharacterized protein LOC113122341 [Mastacembelus armatus]